METQYVLCEVGTESYVYYIGEVLASFAEYDKAKRDTENVRCLNLAAVKLATVQVTTSKLPL
jgi:hypothetical protein